MFLSYLVILIIVIVVLVHPFTWNHDIPYRLAKKRNHPSLRGIHNACWLGVFMLTPLLTATPAHASMFEGETLDMVANILSWAVLVIAPAVGITVFWLLHIMPEKIAYKKQHPQAEAIHTLCLLSLFFGGLLWPLAWLWTYSKPVLYKMAYGTDKVDHGHGKADHATPAPVEGETTELERLRKRIAELENKPAAEGAKA